MDYQSGLKAILDNSATLVNWALAVMGGTVAAVIGSSYERPKTWPERLMYLLFIPAWILLGCSIFAGKQISGRFIAAQLASDPKNVRETIGHMNDDFFFQWSMLESALVVLFVWLIWFLIWFIFFSTKDSEKKNSDGTSGTTNTGRADAKI